MHSMMAHLPAVDHHASEKIQLHILGPVRAMDI
ncbi:hypothetical protein SAMN06265218_101294 [Fodinibius sediminis]|uniref:Uncharacterized protein n=1 Tax=Fodinibius sediminis TaxID=1214077 RepID=A0A521AQW3_9BACT|nr:hypothetical protein SAMN06265218_101294 [Fodinibius sediminis]